MLTVSWSETAPADCMHHKDSIISADVGSVITTLVGLIYVAVCATQEA